MSFSGSLRQQVARHVAQTGSMKGAMASLKRSQIPTDLGILPGTLVHPRPEDKPSWFSRTTFRDRFKTETTILFGPLKNLITQWSTRDPADPVTGKKGAIKLKLSERYYIARDLHRRLYTALAEGNRHQIEKIACQGTQRQAIMKLDARKADKRPAEKWSIEYRGYTPKEEMQQTRWAWFKQMIIPPMFKSTRIISDQVVPIANSVKIRQTIVQIKGRQTLDRGDGTPVKKMDTDEYVVIQHLIKDGKDDPWMIWGTMERSGKREIEEILSQSRSAQLSRGSFWSKVSENASKMSAGM